MILLKATTEILEILTTSTADIDYSVSYADITTTTFSPSTSEGKITIATTTTIVAAPAASTQRQIKLITVTNRHASASNNITFKKDISGTEYFLAPTVTLLAGETMQYVDGQGWVYYSVTGAIKDVQTAAGSDTQVQFNDSGTISGDPALIYDKTLNRLSLGTDSAITLGGVTAEPAIPSVGNLLIYAKSISGRMSLKQVGPAGIDTPLQNAIWQNNTVLFTPGASAGVWQGTVGSNLGTAGLVIPTTTNLGTMLRRSTFASVVTTLNQQVGTRTESMFFRGNATSSGGFFFNARFMLATWTAGDRLFVGMSSGTTAVVTVQPSTLLNLLGFCIEAGDTAITFLHNDGTGTGTKDTIAGQPALATNQGYAAYIFCKPNDSTVYWRLDDINLQTTIAEGSTSTDLPVNTTALTAQCIMSNGANTVAGHATIGVNRIYIETDV
ncbi:hypothetical protein BH10PAT4_BH10PAT4_0990 [soil metagenome]